LRRPAGALDQEAERVCGVARFMDAVGLSSAVIGGHSMGSIAATWFAILHPARTAGLVVMAGATTVARLGLDEMNDELDALPGDEYVDHLRGFQDSTLARPIPGSCTRPWSARARRSRSRRCARCSTTPAWSPATGSPSKLPRRWWRR
jgi:pimeloyl-ACP methyl ester carboxylesterase